MSRPLTVALVALSLLVVPGVPTRRPPLGPAGCFAQDFTPTHRTQVDLWVRNAVPRYSFKTGRWLLGEPLGVLPQGTEVRALRREVVGFTQLWLEVRYRLPDGTLAGGPGHWIWAGRQDAPENVVALPGAPGDQGSLRWPPSFLVGEAWAQGDSYPGEPALPAGPTAEDEVPRAAVGEGREIRDALTSGLPALLNCLGCYLFVLLGMSVGAGWEWVSGRSRARDADLGRGALRILIGSAIAFSFFLGPVLGFGEIAFSISSAILAFHFGLVHSDPTQLVRSLKQRSAEGG